MLVLWLVILFLGMPVAYAMAPPKIAVVDVFIQAFVINGKEAPQYTDEKGATHYSKKEYYMVTAAKGAIGGPVRYRFFLEQVNFTSPEGKDSLPKYILTGPPVFQSSKAEMIDSAEVAKMSPEIFGKLPGSFTNPKR